MIEIKDKKDCCGCMACLQVCPQSCITTYEDNEGFIYPQVKRESCINCSLCEHVCPQINKKNKIKQTKVYAAINKDELIRKKSSSGGIFTLLATQIIIEGGVVFGAAFDSNWNVVHKYTETIEELPMFMGSKYVQSKIGDSYKRVKDFLKIGRKVLFSGTPCQIVGLKLYLKNEYDNLYTTEVKCHGVPSPKVWKYYFEERKEKNKDILAVEFRNKDHGWYNYNFKISFKDSTDFTCSNYNDLFFKAFLQHIIIRPSCYQCMYKNGSSLGDIMLADFWNIKNVYPELDDNKGVSCVITKNETGEQLFESITSKLLSRKTTYDNFGGRLEDYKVPKKREKFFKELNKGENISSLINKYTKPNMKDNILSKCKKILFRLSRFKYGNHR